MAEPPEQPRQLAPLAQKLVESAVAGGAALAALTGSPEAVGAAAAAPLVGHGLAQAGAIIRQRWRRNAGEMLAEAARRAELEDDQLLERLLATPARQELLAGALEAAAHATLKEKIRALGQAMAEGALGDDARVDREFLFVRAAADLERPHVRVLQLLAEGGGFSRHAGELAAASGIGSAVQLVLAALERQGAVHQAGGSPAGTRVGPMRLDGPIGRWAITEFGLEILGRLRAAGEVNP